MEIRLTAQLVLSDSEAILAYSLSRVTRGPSGETNIAALLRTGDAGASWAPMSFRRTWLDGIRHWGYPTWPPEAIMELTNEHSRIQMSFRDEWVPFEPGGESLWQAIQHQNGRWTTSRVRYMDYDGPDSPSRIEEITLRLPTTMKKPGDNLLKELVS